MSSTKNTKKSTLKKFFSPKRIIYVALTVCLLLAMFIPRTSGGTNYPLQKGNQVLDDLSGSQERFDAAVQENNDRFQAFVNESLRMREEYMETKRDAAYTFSYYDGIRRHFPSEIATLKSRLANAPEDKKPTIEAKIAEKQALFDEAYAFFAENE